MSDRSYINPWQFKPWWCQPWSIVLTGFSMILGSWVIWHRFWITIICAVPVTTWMGYFLIFWPLAIQPYLLNESLGDRDREKT